MSTEVNSEIRESDIAIIGMSGRFPGARDLDTFWENLRDGVESIAVSSQSTSESAPHSQEFMPNDPAWLADPNYVKAAGILSDIDLFDASFFGYSGRDAEMMDPQQRLFLECAWEAIEGAGYNPQSYEGLIGVYAGAAINSYLINNVHPNRGFSANRNFLESMANLQLLVSNDKDFLPTRVSYKLNLRGPSVSVQTACSTALVAVHLACQSLLSGECDMALAGAASILVPQENGYLYQEDMIFSPDGHCRTFDARAQGTVFGSGVGVVFLKPLQDAIADGDVIHAVIKGSAINNDGSMKVGYTAPSVDGQAAVVAEALRVADVDPRTITYVEAHGTGTALGDPIEVTALTQAFAESLEESAEESIDEEESLPEQERQWCAIGSVKPNIGHTGWAAGMAGLFKTVLALKHKALPATLHFSEPNPRIDFQNSPFYVNAQLSEWQTDGDPRRAGVSAFGMGGTNAHLILEEAPPLQQAQEPWESFDKLKNRGEESPSTSSGTVGEPAWQLVTLSARSEEALRDVALAHAAHLARHDHLDLTDLSFTVNSGRRHFTHRLAITTQSTQQLGAQLRSFSQQRESIDPSSSLFSGHLNRRQAGRSADGAVAPRQIAFLFTGQGSQYIGMGRQLYATQPVFRASLEQCDEILQPLLGCSLLDVLYSEDAENSGLLEQTAYTQPALFALEYALAELWKSWGIEPHVVIGHSVGEYVAACVAGVFSLEDGLTLIAERGRLMQALPQDGAMVAVFADAEQVERELQPWIDTVSIGAINGPQSVVLSGEQQAVQAVCERLHATGIKTKPLNVSHAFHSPLMEPVLADFAQVAQQISYAPPRLKLIANVTGQLAADDIATADYWVSHIRQPVRFADGMETLSTLGVETLLEIGPKPTLLGLGRQCLPDHDGLWLPSLHPERDAQRQILNSLAQVYVAGFPIDWAGFHSAERQPRRLQLPTYPFQRERYWIDAPKSWLTQVNPPVDTASTSRASAASASTEQTAADWFYELAWQPKTLDITSGQNGSDVGTTQGTDWLIFADESGIGQQVAGYLSARGERPMLVFAKQDYQQLDGARYSVNPQQQADFSKLFNTIDHKQLQGVVYLWGLNEPQAQAESQWATTELAISGLIFTVQALLQAEHSPHLWLVTQGAQSVLPSASSLAVTPSGKPNIPSHQLLQAPLWGVGRVLALEHPELSTTCLDLAPEQLAQMTLAPVELAEIETEAADPAQSNGKRNGKLNGSHNGTQNGKRNGKHNGKLNGAHESVAHAQALLQELRFPDGEREVAYRGGSRYVARLVSKEAESFTPETEGESASLIHADGTYLVTGGLGALGLAVARWLVHQGARHLLLIGRSGAASTAAQDAVSALEEAGAEVLVVKADVSILDDVQRVVNSGSKPLRGVIHAAGVLDDGVFMLQSVERFRRVMAPKAQGAWNLHLATRDLPLDFFVCFSSIASLIGSSGQSNYAAANAFMDALAHHRQQLGLPALSINWGAWADGGMAADLSDRDAKRLAERGLKLITEALGLQAMGALIDEGQASPQVAVLPIDWSRWLAQFDDVPPLLEAYQSLAGEDRGDATHTSERAEAWNSELTEIPRTFRQQLVEVPTNKRLARLEAHVRSAVGQVLGPTPSPLTPTQGFFEMGMDSLTSIELRNLLQASLECALSPTLAFNYPTLESLLAYLAEKVLDPMEASAEAGDAEAGDGEASEEVELERGQPEAVLATAASMTNIEDLAEEEAEALLLKQLEGFEFD